MFNLKGPVCPPYTVCQGEKHFIIIIIYPSFRMSVHVVSVYLSTSFVSVACVVCAIKLFFNDSFCTNKIFGSQAQLDPCQTAAFYINVKNKIRKPSKISCPASSSLSKMWMNAWRILQHVVATACVRTHSAATSVFARQVTGATAHTARVNKTALTSH